MEQIYPLSKETCQPYVGRRICAVLYDGTHVTGTIDSITDEGIVFGDAYPGVGVLSTNAKKAKSQLKNKAQTKAYGYGGLGYGGLGGGLGYPGYGYGNGSALAFSSIALAFLLPFFFI
jgi:hypothetical protein